MLLPTLAKAKKKANRIKCAAKLSQLGKAYASYSTDSNGYFKISGLAEGKYSVLAQARGYGSASKNDVEADGEPIELALEPGESDELQAAVTNADGVKCERCWRVMSEVGGDDEYPGVCRRCADAVGHVGSAAE